MVIVTALASLGSMVAAWLGVYHRLFELLAGESVAPEMRAGCAARAFAGLRVIPWAYPLLLIVSLMPLWAPVLSGWVRLERGTLKHLRGSLAWISFYGAALAILCLEPYKHIALFTVAERLPVAHDEPCRHAKLRGSGCDYADFVLDPSTHGANIRCLARLARQFACEPSSHERLMTMTISQRPLTTFPEPFDDVVANSSFAQLRLAQCGKSDAETVTPAASVALTASEWRYDSPTRTGVFDSGVEGRSQQFSEVLDCEVPTSLTLDDAVLATDVISLVRMCEPGFFVLYPDPATPLL